MDTLRKRKIKYGVLAAIFCAIFFHFFYHNRFYIPSVLTVSSHASASSTAKLFWDSGAGFNDRESYTFIPYEVQKFDKQPHVVEITRLAETNPLSGASEVWLDSILLDETTPLDLNSVVYQGKSYIHESGKLVLEEPGATVTFMATFEAIDIIFYCHQWAGQARITIDGVIYNEDLYSPHTVSIKKSYDKGALPGVVENKFSLPQLDIKALKLEFSNNSVAIDKLLVSSEKGTIDLSPVERSNDGTILLESLDLKTESFRWLLLVVQLITATILTIFISYIWTYINKAQQGNIKQTLTNIFTREQRWFFWILFVVSSIVYSLWLIGQWPGIMTVDSYHYTWREIKTFEFQNVTPLIYNLYVLALTQILDSPVIVGFIQIIVTSFVGSLILFYCYKGNANKWIVYICSALFIGSIPVGIYNITIWKDIPFSTLMLIWGFIVYYLFYKKKFEKQQVNLSLFKLCVLAFLFFLVCTLRHNGLVLVVAIPAALFFLKLINRKNFLYFSVASLVIFSIYYIVTPMIAQNTTREVSEFFSKTYKVAPLAAIYTSKSFYSPNIAEDKLLISKWMSDEELRENYSPVMQADTVGYMMGKWNAMPLEDQNRLAELYVTRSLQNPNIFLSDRLSMTLGTMGLSSNVFITTNALRDADVDRSDWRPIEAYRFTISPKSEWLEKIENKVITKSVWYTGEFPIPFLIFNTLPAFVILLVVLLLYRVVPGAALYSSLFLYNIPFMFIALSTCEWRYFYFLLLASYFVLPIASMEYRTNRRLRAAS